MNLKFAVLALTILTTLTSSFARDFGPGRYNDRRDNRRDDRRNDRRDTTTTTVVIKPGGMEIRYGETRIVRGHRAYRVGRININDTVITSNGRVSKVVGIFPSDRTIIVRDNFFGDIRTLPIDNVAVTSGCVNSLCVGDKVITQNRRDSTIEGFFSDGTMVVKDTFFSDLRTVGQDSIAITTGCTEMFCVGDKTITRANRESTIVGFYGNGTIVLKDSFFGDYRLANAYDLALISGVCTNIYTSRIRTCR